MFFGHSFKGGGGGGGDFCDFLFASLGIKTLPKTDLFFKGNKFFFFKNRTPIIKEGKIKNDRTVSPKYVSINLNKLNTFFH